MTNTVVLVSGGGGNLQALLDLREFDELPELNLAAVISSVPGAYALERARAAEVPAFVLDRAGYSDAAELSRALLAMLRERQADLVVCAGFRERLSSELLRAYRGRIINVQPALFPAFCAGSFDPVAAVRETLRLGLRVTGATAYFLGAEDNGYGPVITQRVVEVRADDTVGALAERIMRQGEWPALAEAVSLFCRGRIRMDGDRVEIRDI